MPSSSSSEQFTSFSCLHRPGSLLTTDQSTTHRDDYLSWDVPPPAPSKAVVVGRSLTVQQHASVSQGRVGSNNCTCCHIETTADQTCNPTQSQYTDTGPTSPALTLCQAPGRVTTGVPLVTCMSYAGKKSLREKREPNPRLPLSRRTHYHWAHEAVNEART